MMQHKIKSVTLAFVVAVGASLGFMATAGQAAAGDVTITTLQYNAAEGTDSCPDPTTADCLAPVNGNTGRNVYNVEEICSVDVERFRAEHAGWSVLYATTTTNNNLPDGSPCKQKGNMIASPHLIDQTAVYSLSGAFSEGGIDHDFTMICGRVHGPVGFFDCATHLIYGGGDSNKLATNAEQLNRVANLTSGYRTDGKAIVAGDFNIPEDSAGAGSTARLAPMNSAGYVETDPNNTATHNGNKFDYIFYYAGKGVSGRAAAVGGSSTSDHAVLIGQANI